RCRPPDRLVSRSGNGQRRFRCEHGDRPALCYSVAGVRNGRGSSVMKKHEGGLRMLRIPTKTMAIALLALSAGTARAADNAAMEHATLALPAINLGFLSRFVADDEGLWKKEGIDVTVQVIQGVGSTNAVIAGSIDFAFASAATITRAKARGQN